VGGGGGGGGGSKRKKKISMIKVEETEALKRKYNFEEKQSGGSPDLTGPTKRGRGKRELTDRN